MLQGTPTDLQKAWTAGSRLWTAFKTNPEYSPKPATVNVCREKGSERQLGMCTGHCTSLGTISTIHIKTHNTTQHELIFWHSCFLCLTHSFHAKPDFSKLHGAFWWFLQSFCITNQDKLLIILKRKTHLRLWKMSIENPSITSSAICNISTSICWRPIEKKGPAWGEHKSRQVWCQHLCSAQDRCADRHKWLSSSTDAKFAGTHWR